MIHQLLALLLLLVSVKSYATNQDDIPKEQQNKNTDNAIYIVAYKNDRVPIHFPSTANHIDSEYINDRQYTDVNRILTNIPSVNIRPEDGFGLRPNIGIRGSRTERSANITLLEDGTLIAPAPYAAPSAYYFPDVMRMSKFEVYKGGSVTKYGPRTTSGIFNMVTEQIDGKSDLTFSYGSFEEKILNAKVSNKGEHAGFVFATTQRNSEGFRKIEMTDQKAGYDQKDYMLKLSFNTDKDKDIYNQFDIKIAQQDHDSDQSYLGLTRDDFNSNPNRQYAASQLDNIKAKHKQLELKHMLKNKNLQITTKAYRNRFHRNWYKLNKVNGLSLGTILDDPSTYATELSYIRGDVNSLGGLLDIKANNRSYVSQGVQIDSSYKIVKYNIAHDIEAGVRLHSDYEDRFQKSDQFDMLNGMLSLKTVGQYGSSTANNRKNSAIAFSGYAKDSIIIGNFTSVFGIRYEDINLKTEEWSNSARTTLSKNVKNNVNVILPSFSASYLINEDSAVFAGIHEGFAPPSPGSEADNESSVNYELGYRLRNTEGQSFVEVATYFNNYNNLLGIDTLAGAGSGSGNQFNGGSVHAYGLEVLTGKTFAYENFSFPVTISYTYTDAKFKSTFTENGVEEWGDVRNGDRLPYIAQHQFTLNTGIKYQKFHANLLTRFVGNSYADASSTKKVPSYLTFDVFVRYQLKANLTLFTTVDNITNREYIVSYTPYGLRGGKPIAVKVGGTYNF